MALLPLPKKNQGIAEHDLQVKGTRAADSVRRSDTGTQLTLTQGLVPTHPRRTAALQSKIRELKSAIPESPQRRGKGWNKEVSEDRLSAYIGFNPLKGGARAGTALCNSAQSGLQREIGYPLFGLSANLPFSSGFPQDRVHLPEPKWAATARFEPSPGNPQTSPPFGGSRGLRTPNPPVAHPRSRFRLPQTEAALK